MAESTPFPASHPFLEDLFTRAVAAPGRIILPEGEDPRVCRAACTAAAEGLAHPILLGNPESIRNILPDRDIPVTIRDPATCSRIADYTSRYADIRHAEGLSRQDAEQAVLAPPGYAAMAVRCGDADGMLGGAVHTTAEILRAALKIIGPARGVRTVSSFFLMLDTIQPARLDVPSLFADCALIIDPDSDELAAIAQAATGSARTFLATDPIVAFLSFSTAGSGRHPRVETVRLAAERLRRDNPHLAVLGDIQFDAAIDRDIGQRKNPQATFPGRPNVFIFPNLDAGNIGYKIAERVGKMMAIGPILQGLAHPANDLSRGCSESDILAMIAITSLQAAHPQPAARPDTTP